MIAENFNSLLQIKISLRRTHCSSWLVKVGIEAVDVLQPLTYFDGCGKSAL